MLPILLLGTGPTLSNFDVGQFCNKCHVIAVSDAYKVCPWADILYSCDRSWWEYHEEKLTEFKGRRVTLDWDAEQRPYPGAEALMAVPKTRRGFSMEKGVVYMGHNSGFQALQLAAQLSGRVYMAGFDMGITGNTHFFGEHPPELTTGSDYALFVGDFESTIQEIRKHCSVSLLTPSNLNHLFNTITIKEAMYEL